MSGPVLPVALSGWGQNEYSPLSFSFQHPVAAGRFLSLVIADAWGRQNHVTGITDSRGNAYTVDDGSPTGEGTIYVAECIPDHAIQVGDTLSVAFLSDVPPYASGSGSALRDGIWYSVHVAATAFSDTIESLSSLAHPRGLDGWRGPQTVTLTITPGSDDSSRLATQPDLLIAYFVCGQNGINDGGWNQFLHVIDAHDYPAPGDPGVTPNELFGSWQLATTPGARSYTVTSPSVDDEIGYGAAVVAGYKYTSSAVLSPPTIIPTTVAAGTAPVGLVRRD